ncbi:YrrS family protein [Sporosarcina ureilytica]|uniref:DUF1510 domain-containing protein n=1 Tax=Sporosarcina ureilytica TaxID=298596 RepID=A0A1D8JGV9_9BACL|nr:YrrS family protein [Sporosarcina ureilytica]AOV07931.1 hypothetical protein BI350_10540 [Sporosarcina ureilytica]
MNNPNHNFSRLDRKKKRKDKILNVLIAAVVVAIVITSSIIFLGGDKEQSDKEDVKNNEEIVEQNKDDEVSKEEDPSLHDEEVEEENVDIIDEDTELEEVEDVEITVDPNDPIVSQSIVNPAWEPIGTEQTGEHASVYKRDSIDWIEKERALTYATGLSADNMIIWKLKNGGSPQKSIGIVSSKDKTEKYQVFLEWVDNEGWKPVKMDVLTTLDFNY